MAILSPKPKIKCATIHESSGENCPNEGVHEIGIDYKSASGNKPLMVCEGCKGMADKILHDKAQRKKFKYTV